MKTNIFDGLAFLSLFLVVVLLPIFSLPFTNIPVETSKGLLLVAGLALSVIFWAIARFSDGKIIFPKSALLASGLGIVLVFLLSSLFSGSSQVSLFGTMFDIGSFWFIFAAFVLMFMSSVVFRTPRQGKTMLLGIILSSALLLVFQSIHLFLPAPLSLGILAGKTGSILGSWNALGLFAGFTGLMSLFMIEFFSISKAGKVLLQVLTLFSLLLISAVNFPLIWALLGVSGLIIFVYKISTTFGNDKEGEEKEEQERRQFPLASFLVAIVSLLFFISPNFIGSVIPSRLQISISDVSPSLPATLSITKGVLSESPVFGIGPNRFGEAWSMHKPVSINNTQFWDVSFESGSGLLPALTATSGGLGILAWVIFFVLLLWIGLGLVFLGAKDKINWEIMMFFVLSLYLFISSFFYSTGSVIFLLAFAFTGVFIGLSASLSFGREVTLSFLNDPRKSFFSILALVLLIIVSATASFKYVEKFSSVFYFGRAVSASTESVAEDSINKALSLHRNDLYLRAYSQINLAKLNSLIKKGEDLSEAEKTDLQKNLDGALGGAQLAITYNPKNYLNFQALGSVYQAAASLGVKEAFGQAIEAYQAASVLNPFNPGLKLAMARVSFTEGKVKEAKDYANAALSLKPDYVDALIVLSQIAKNEGDNKGALSYAQSALSFAPDDENLIKYVDSLNNSAFPSEGDGSR
ncbi:TPA: hypothetical protein DEQ22_01630 [Candidatus Nomurabacteria bacterium]|uniref:Uncharacterized protein n=2 Tax=Candidatus Nomuraibacteriota TaxID=1752729 RepID=A0A1F6YMJ9_9BACT|nr:MAG: Tfp pilus assembly protein PilF [Parcubacteria group bacterium GW2011_GWC1_42_21]KKS58359.1 MAG: Tfp pilus assembly protein PilF [Candidatus Nomurabacteria bacterium GW2011_GWF1_42_40]KKT00161.1 MAG: Tfp pilus assembly protein PilF [Candidatus Nomurabacteria bacterium GW2011_GWA1_43_17]KKT11024.1 MAG: Tfp pilus assembly protein PilF [Candidatus Nomurabacteria bacterium GW2011_GWF2_43_24]KKT18261.1 MAG: Tfp pilus assembly protein PilF [Candidatus Nomurabacteria bacterium GW2011_GWA2_43_6